jgi:hypothetical protein
MTLRAREVPPDKLAGLSRGPNEIGHYHHSSTPHSTVNGSKRAVRVEGRIVGSLQGNTFTKRVKGSKHQLSKPPAWCISKEAFVQDISPNVSRIVIEDTESEKSYECSTQTFDTYSFEIQRGAYEPQLALSLNFWQVSSTSNEQLTLWGPHEW